MQANCASNQVAGTKVWIDLAPAAYFLLYFIYLWFFLELESELTHWATLVVLPFGLYALADRTSSGSFRWSLCLHRVGLSRGALTRGLGPAVAWGLALGSLQLLLSRQRDAVLASIVNGEFFYKMPLAFVLMLGMAASTEEFFFRGLLQTSLRRRTSSRWLSTVIAAAAFGIYHFPYAYKLDTWSSHGNLSAALGEGVLMSFVIGLILGALYERYNNLLVPVIVHAAFNAVWASAMIKM